MAAEVVSFQGGEQIRFEQCGEGPDVLLIHGTLVTLEDMMLGLGCTLAPHFRVTAVDRPGHGLSTRRRLHRSLRDQTMALKRAVDHLGLHRPVVVGHSLGATVAFAYGMGYSSEVAGVVGLAPIVMPELRFKHVLFGPRAAPLTR